MRISQIDINTAPKMRILGVSTKQVLDNTEFKGDRINIGEDVYTLIRPI